MSQFGINVPFTTATGGAATVYSQAVDGQVQSIIVDPGTATSVAVAVTEEDTGFAILTKAGIAAKTRYLPRVPVQDTSGVNIAGQYAPAPVIGRIKVAITAGGDAKVGSVTFYVDGPGEASRDAMAVRTLSPEPAVKRY